MGSLSSWIDPRSIVAVGIEDAHEGERGRAVALARVEQHHRDVAGLAVEVAQQRRGAEERVERAGAPDEREGAVDLRRGSFDVLADDAGAVGGEPALGPSIRGMSFDLT
jgi:hypothetical protein